MTRARVRSKWDRERQTVSFTIRFPCSKTGKDTRIEPEQSYSLLNKRNGPWGFEKANDDLRKQMNDFIKQFKETGGFEQLGEKYLGENKKAFDDLGIPFYF